MTTSTVSYFVKFNKPEAFVWKSAGVGKNGRPKLAPDKSNKVTNVRYNVSALEKFSGDDKGDGVIHADDDRTFFYVCGGDAMFPSRYIRVNEVTPLIIIDLYTVKSGDTLSGIAQHYYKNGDKEHFMAIFNANPNTLTDPGQITEGQKLIIPKF